MDRGALQPDRVGEHLVATALTDDPRILPALLVSAGAGQRYQALSVLARALANPSIAADPKDRLGEQLRDVITMGVEGAALMGIRLRRGLPSSGGACQRVSAAEERIRSFSRLPCGPLSATVPAIIAARSSFQDHECGSRPARAVRLGQKCWTFPKTGRPNASTRIFTL